MGNCLITQKGGENQKEAWAGGWDLTSYDISSILECPHGVYFKGIMANGYGATGKPYVVLEGSNDGNTFTEIKSESISDGRKGTEATNTAYRFYRCKAKTTVKASSGVIAMCAIRALEE